MTIASAPMLLVCDLDGTLTFSRSRPAESVMRALAQADARPDVRLSIATARSPRCVRRWFGELGRRIEMICCNGALHLAPGGRVTRHALPPASLRVLVDRLDATGVGYCLEYGDHFSARSAAVLPWMGTEHRRVLGRRPPGLDGVLKCSVDRGDLAVELALGLPGLSAVVHATGDGDVTASGVTKATALAPVRAPGELVVAFGNDLNDLDLLRGADRAVVVGTGLPWLDELPHVRRVPAEPGCVARTLGEMTTVVAACA